MAGSRRLAVLVEPDGLGLRQRELGRGIARYARSHTDWQAAVRRQGAADAANYGELPSRTGRTHLARG